jgi:amino-acid N-acetyltransferase
MLIRDAWLNEFPRWEVLLREAGLPIPGPEDPEIRALFAVEGAEILGSVGWERWEDAALLRSVAVGRLYQQSGIGRSLVSAALARLRSEGVREVCLFTVGAAPFFARFGFSEVPRASLPEVARRSREFAMHACDSAHALRCDLSSVLLPAF